MTYLWFIGQTGIVLEVVGAATLVFSAYNSSKTIRKHKTDMDHIEFAVEQLMEDTKNQFKTQTRGFVLLVVGLGMQFIGGFA
ncbi:MAG: hypothetical protein OEZ39_05290 [Gammaproteobacteria bacterium]|nr:hypothetical protein [Gammaproteobacteria bacterium]MDH5651268.1 hypothetical protein [Gammaproteobacteria bacterium]